MLVKLLVSRAGVRESNSAGDVIEVSDSEASRMFEAGQAVPATAKQRKETATQSRLNVSKAVKL